MFENHFRAYCFQIAVFDPHFFAYIPVSYYETDCIIAFVETYHFVVVWTHFDWNYFPFANPS